MRKPNDMSRCLAAFNQDSTLVAVIELGLKSWLVAGIVPGIERHPLKKLKPDEGALLALLYRWCEEARKAGHPVKRICVAFEAGRDGFWLARWLRNHKIEAYVIHPTSVHGLIRGSFVPDTQTQELRALMRTRKQLVREAASHIQRVQKTLEDA